MDQNNTAVLCGLLKAAIHGDSAPAFAISQENCLPLLALAMRQHVDSIIMPVLLPLLSPGVASIIEEWKNNTILRVAKKAQCNTSVIILLETMRQNGLEACIVKGVMHARNYPEPMYRLSSDSDILIKKEDAEKYIDLLKGYNFNINYEINDHHYQAYHSTYGLIELHVELFNRYSTENWFVNFTDLIQEPFAQYSYEDASFYSIGNTDHFIFSALHAIKHFISSGMTLAQACDIWLYADKQREHINWDRVWNDLTNASLGVWLAALLELGEQSFAFDFSKIPGYTPPGGDRAAALLKDMITYTGLNDSKSRQLIGRSSAEDLKTMNRSGVKLWLNMLFSSKHLRENYIYAKKHAVLLPVAWFHRIFKAIWNALFHREKGERNTNTTENIHTRINLLDKLNMLK